MQLFVKQRATENGDIVFETPAIDVSEQPLLTHELIVYNIAGTSPSITAQMETSNDLLTWTPLGSPGSSLSRTAAGAIQGFVQALNDAYGKYIRYQITTTGPLTAVQYSLILTTFPSS